MIQSSHNRRAERTQNAACPTLPSMPLVARPSFSASPSGGTLQGATGGGTGTGQTIYSYCVSGPSNTCSPANAGYDSVGNLLGYTDSVMGTWSFGYDSLNRLLSGTPAASNTGNASNNGMSLCWSYDSFGNRTAESARAGTCPSLPSVPITTYNSNNQVTGTSIVATSMASWPASKNGSWNQATASLHSVRSRFLLKNKTLRSRFTMSTLNALLASRRCVGALPPLAHQVSEPRHTKRVSFHGLVLLAMSLGVTASAQIPSVTDVTAPPTPGVGHDYIQENVETVNPANGSLSVRIGVPLPKSRGINIPFDFAYDSGSVYFLSQNIYSGYSGFQWWYSATPFSQGGWSYGVPMLSVQDTPFSGVLFLNDQYSDIPISCHMWTDYVFQNASGARTNLGISFPENNQNGCNTLNLMVEQTEPSYDSPTSTGAFLAAGTGPLVSQVGSTIAVTSPIWSSEATVNAVDVTDGDGTDYHFNLMAAPSYGYLNGRWGQVTGIAPPSSISDRNGNTAQLILGIAGQSTLKYIDSIGRTSLSISSFGSNPDTLTVSGLSEPYRVNWTSAGANFPITMTNLAQFDGYTNCIPSTGSPANGGGNEPVGSVISSIALPNGQQYGFTYDATYGLVNQINYPTGGYVLYTWGLNPQSQYGSFTNYTQKPVIDPRSGTPTGQTYPSPTGGCSWHYDSPAILNRYVYNVGGNSGQNGGVGPNGGYLVEQQDFSYTTTWNAVIPKYWTQKQTTVITHDFVQQSMYKTVYTYGSVMSDFQPNANVTQSQVPVESSIQYYGYYGNNWVLLQSVGKVWENQRLMTQQTTTLASGQISETDMTYNCNEMMSEKDEYGFGAGSEIQTPPSNCLYPANYASSSAPRGTLVRKTLIPSYHSFSQNVLDKPDSVKVEDTSDKVKAGVSYQYDPNGNILSRSDWLNETGTSALTTSHTYDGYGNIQTTTDPKKNLTRYSYTDMFVDSCSLPSPSNAFLTKITYPTPSSEVQLVKSFQYHCATGDLAVSTDENNKSTNYFYGTLTANCTTQDRFDRLTEVDYPDGGKTTHCYNDASPNPTVQTATLMNSAGQSKVTLTTLDGLGQPIKSELSDTDGGTIYVDTVYDGLGHVNSVSNPYRQNTEPTYGLTTNTYDGLGRLVTTVHPDSSSSTWCYDGVPSSSGTANCSQQLGSATIGTWVGSTDENGNHWQRTSDSLGRLTEVMELGSLANPLSLETDYGYDTLNNLLSVNQKGNGTSDVARVRSFSYDSVSRLIAVRNPETASSVRPPSLSCSSASGSSWTACYGYDQNGNLAFKTDNRGITTSFGYDTLNRVLSRTYSDSATQASCYQYDTAANGKGRLASAWTLSASSGVSCPKATPFLTKRAITQYDEMGRILNEQQFTLANQVVGYSPAYFYDLAGNLLSSTSGVAPAPTFSPITLTNLYDSAGRLQTVMSNVTQNWTNGAALPSILFAPPLMLNASCINQLGHYTAFGGLQNNSFGIGSINTAITLNRGYDNRLRTTCENDMGAGTTGSTPGSVVVTISGSELPH